MQTDGDKIIDLSVILRRMFSSALVPILVLFFGVLLSYFVIKRTDTVYKAEAVVEMKDASNEGSNLPMSDLMQSFSFILPDMNVAPSEVPPILAGNEFLSDFFDTKVKENDYLNDMIMASCLIKRHLKYLLQVSY